MAVNSAANIVVEDAADEMFTEANLDFFQSATPGNVKFIESLWFLNQENEKLTALLTKAYGGYAFAVNETNYLADQMADNENQFNKVQAMANYSKAMDYGFHYLKLAGINKKQIIGENDQKKLKKLLESELDEDDFTAVFYLAQSWAGLINLDKRNIMMVSQLPKIKTMFDWVCEKRPDFEFGSCKMFYGAFEFGRIGGNRPLGKKIFRKMIKDQKYNLLARVAFLQFYAVPSMDEDEYNKQGKILKKEFLEFDKQFNFGKRLNADSKYQNHKEYNLYNSVAKKRFLIYEKYKKDIF